VSLTRKELKERSRERWERADRAELTKAYSDILEEKRRGQQWLGELIYARKVIEAARDNCVGVISVINAIREYDKVVLK